MRPRPFLLLIAGFALALMAGEVVADDLGTPMLTGGENWAAVADEPAEVGDGALSVSWDKTDVVTGNTAISIGSQAQGYSPSYIEVVIGTIINWTNNDTISHTVTDENGEFDSGTFAPGNSWEYIFDTIGTYTYYCSNHPAMQGTVMVVAAVATEQARTPYVPLWTEDSYLMFWANFSMSDDSSINVIAQEKGYDLDSPQTVKLTENNGFSIVSVSNGTVMGDFLKGNTDDQWKKYQIHLDSEKLPYNYLNYDPYEDNAYSFVFSIRGIEGSAAIGGLQLIRALDTGFYFGKVDRDTRVYEIFPSLGVDITYTARNIGTLDNVLEISPALVAGGEYWSIYRAVTDSDSGAPVTTTSIESTTSIPLAADQQVTITLSIWAPDYNWDTGEPASNRMFDLDLNAYDTGSDDELREPVTAKLFVRPPQFGLGEMMFDKMAVLEGDSLDITVKAWNEGNYASDVLVVFYVIDANGSQYDTPDGIQRLTRVASTTIPRMLPVEVIENQGAYRTWYEATATWNEVFIPDEMTEDFKEVEIYAQINPVPEPQDLDAGHKSQDEYLNQKDDNGGFGNIIVMDKTQSESGDCYVGFGYPIPLGGGDTTVGPEIEMCEGNPTNTSAIKTVTDKDSGGNWIVTIIVPFDGWKANPNLQASVNSVHWYLLDTMANTVSDGLVSEVYGYYPGEGKAVIFVDNDFDGKLSPGDKFEIHPGESGSDLANVGSVDGYTFWLYYFTDTPPVVPAGGGGYAVCLPGDTKTADDGCNQCVCNYGEWACTEVDCNPDDSDGVLPAPSLAAAVAAVAVIALFRPRKP